LANKISVIILTKNSNKYIKECLNALTDFNEIIILDNGSTDNTLDIVKQFDNTKIFENEFIGFGPLKNLAISKTTNDWVLSVDSDEIISKQLSNEILNLELSSDNIYSIKRHNYYNKKLVNCCGWNNDFVNRLFDKNSVKFNDNLVHESLQKSDKNTKKLNEIIKHYSFDNAEQLLQKMNHYSSLWANDNLNKKTSSPAKATLKAIFAFIKFYILKGGIFAGYRGVLISLSNANGVFYKYIKLYELQKNKM
jgi:glycosyltransferase involved in cell wall biosynthesis